jgi:hypothetical protein
MIKLSDDQLQTVMTTAAVLDPRDRAPFLEQLAVKLDGQEIGDGLLSRACRETLAQFWQPPQLGSEPRPRRHAGKYAR